MKKKRGHVRLLRSLTAFYLSIVGCYIATNHIINVLPPRYKYELRTISLGIAFAVVCWGVTWIALRFEGRSLAYLGVEPRILGLRLLALGFAIGLGMVLLGIAMLSAVYGFSWVWAAAPSLGTAGVLFAQYLCWSWIEESVFRGYAFRRILETYGVWIAHSVAAAAFVLVHWQGEGGDLSLEHAAVLVLASVVFGTAFLKSGSLMLSTGMHAGWNWLNTSLGRGQFVAPDSYERFPGNEGLQALVGITTLAITLWCLLRWHPGSVGEKGTPGSQE